MISILDCTLRDGGYVNNWEFDTSTALSIRDGLYDAGVRWIEIGILGAKASPGKQTKFSGFDEMEPLLQGRKEDCHYAVMVTTAASDGFSFPKCSEATPDVVRIAYFKPEFQKTLALAGDLLQKGYCVFLQAMATFMYQEEELCRMVDAVNRLHPNAFYMVDSFSTMYPADVAGMRDLILHRLDPGIMFGFHAHNNIQMAFANAQQFMETETTRQILVDSSIYGMGRGAGNVPTELLMDYLNRTRMQGYKPALVLGLYQGHLEGIYKKYGWGYTLPYYLTAVHSLNSAWGWYFMDNGIEDLGQLEAALEMVPTEWAYTLNQFVGAKILDAVKGGGNG